MRTKDITDLEAAVKAIEEAIKLTQHSDDHDKRAECLLGLGKMLAYQFSQTGSMNDLNEAVKLIGESVALTETSADYQAPTPCIKLSSEMCWKPDLDGQGA